MMCDVGEVSYNQIGKYGFEVKREKERFKEECPRGRQNLKIERFHARDQQPYWNSETKESMCIQIPED